MTETTPFRICKHCQKPKPETLDHYSIRIHRDGSQGFRSTCRECRRLLDRQKPPEDLEDSTPLSQKDRVLRPSSKWCVLCANLPWRVVGPRCRNPTCNLLYRDEPKVELVFHRYFERAI